MEIIADGTSTGTSNTGRAGGAGGAVAWDARPPIRAHSGRRVPRASGPGSAGPRGRHVRARLKPVMGEAGSDQGQGVCGL